MSEAKKTADKKTEAKQPAALSKGKSNGGSQAREYIVYRELTLDKGDVTISGHKAPEGSALLVELGRTEAKSAKEARRTVAKAELRTDELQTESGVQLRAITASAANAGRGIARLKVEPTWDD